MKIPFTKMHGIGNDYIYINGYETVIADPVGVAKRISDRHFGVGGDGLILVLPPEKGVDAHVRMRMFNADGSESEMCGNGIRCVCKLAHDRGISKANPMRIQTGRGVLTLEYTTGGDGKVELVTVDMGAPVFEAPKIPVLEEEMDDLIIQLAEDPDAKLFFGNPVSSVEDGVNSRLDIWSKQGDWDWLSIGNPHIAFFVDDVSNIPLGRLGPMIERHRAFPHRINVHFVQVEWRGEVTMRTWERGSGITLACGTGASAVCVAGVRTNRTDREILTHLPGGDLLLRWDEKSNHVFMTGPATEVFTGVWQDKD